MKKLIKSKEKRSKCQSWKYLEILHIFLLRKPYASITLLELQVASKFLYIAD